MTGVGTGGVRARCKKCNTPFQPVLPDKARGRCPVCHRDDVADMQLMIDTVEELNRREAMNRWEEENPDATYEEYREAQRGEE
jgi:hypothetical protein